MKQTVTKESVYQFAEQSFGLVPPMIKEIAEYSVPVAALYTEGVITMDSAGFTAIETNAIELLISSLNNCDSCVKGHSFLSRKAGLQDDDIRAIIERRPTSVDSLNRLLKGTEALFYANREGYAAYLQVLDEEAFSKKEIFEMIGLLSLKTISNNINNYQRALKAMQVGLV